MLGLKLIHISERDPWVAEISYTGVSIGALVSNCIKVKERDVITDQCADN